MADDNDDKPDETKPKDLSAEQLFQMRLEAIVASGARPPEGVTPEQFRAWAEDVTLWHSPSGTFKVVIDDSPDGEPDSKPESKDDSKPEPKDDGEPDDMTETQKAITRGDPTLPAGVHRSFMAGVGTTQKSRLDESVQLSKMHDKEYRGELTDIISSSREMDLRAGLVERSRDFYSRDPLTQAALAGKRETVIPGDLAEV